MKLENKVYRKKIFLQYEVQNKFKIQSCAIEQFYKSRLKFDVFGIKKKINSDNLCSLMHWKMLHH